MLRQLFLVFLIIGTISASTFHKRKLGDGEDCDSTADCEEGFVCIVLCGQKATCRSRLPYSNCHDQNSCAAPLVCNTSTGRCEVKDWDKLGSHSPDPDGSCSSWATGECKRGGCVKGRGAGPNPKRPGAQYSDQSPLSREVVKRTSLATGIFTLLLILIAWLIASLAAFGSSAAIGSSGSAVSGTVLSGNDTNYDKANDAQAQPLSNDHRDNSLARRMDPVVPFLYFQSISSSGLLSLNYPAVYLSFTTIFSWANFILSTSWLERSTFKLRKVCGSSSAGELYGIKAYTDRLGVKPEDLFATAFFVYLCACATVLGLSLTVGIIMQTAAWSASTDERKLLWTDRRKRWSQVSSNNILRIMMISVSPIATFSFYQWNKNCASVLTLCLSAFVFSITLANLGIVTLLILRIASQPDRRTQLFNKTTTYGRRWSSLYDTLNETRLSFLALLLVMIVAKAAVVGFGQKSGMVQVIALLILETFMIINLIRCRPYYSQGYNRLNYLLEICHIVTQIVNFFFIPEFSHSFTSAYNILGYALMGVHSAMALLLVVLTVIKLGWGVLWYRKKHHAFETSTSAETNEVESLARHYSIRATNYPTSLK